MNIITLNLLLGCSFALGFFAIYHFLNITRDIFKTWYLRKQLLNKMNALRVLLIQVETKLKSLDKETEKQSKKKK